MVCPAHWALATLECILGLGTQDPESSFVEQKGLSQLWTPWWHRHLWGSPECPESAGERRWDGEGSQGTPTKPQRILHPINILFKSDDHSLHILEMKWGMEKL